VDVFQKLCQGNGCLLTQGCVEVVAQAGPAAYENRINSTKRA
jgi:hypothetical protein